MTLRLGEPSLLEVLSPSVGYPTPEKLAALASRYSRESSWSAYALYDGEVAVGIVGIELTSPGHGRIRHIAVIPEERGTGVGRSLIERLRERVPLRELYAETDGDAAPFYQHCGFTVRSLGELHPGVERFRCRWRA